MKAGRMLLGAASGFGIGLAREWIGANDDARSKAAPWVKSLFGRNGRPKAEPESTKPVAAISAPVLPKTEEVKMPSAEQGAGVDPDLTIQQREDIPVEVSAIPDAGMDAQKYEDYWAKDDFTTPSYMDDGASAEVVTTPLDMPEIPDYEQSWPLEFNA